jgi:hypothetical protein
VLVCHNISFRRNKVIINRSKMSLLYIITYAKWAAFGCVEAGGGEKNKNGQQVLLHYIFERIGVALYILNLLRAELFDRFYLFWRQIVFTTDLRN